MLKIYLWLFVSWAVLVILAIVLRKSRLGRLFRGFAFILFIFISFELAALIGFRLQSGYWLFNGPVNINARLFEPHPYMIGVPRKNIRVKAKGHIYAHNSYGFRNKEFNLKKSKKRIIAVGGSTTYGIGVNNNETWPYYLDSLLQPEYEVLNFGIPGHSTVEHIIQTSTIVPHYKPDLILIHAGLNDIRNMNVNGLEPDYSNFHAPTLYESFGFGFENYNFRLASVKLINIILIKLQLLPSYPYQGEKHSGTVSTELDQKAIDLFERNLQSLVSICKAQNVQVVFLPQIILEENVEAGQYKWWAPYVAEEVFAHHLDAYNKKMEGIASRDSLTYVNEILQFNWENTDFVDPSHLDEKGNLKFAKIVARAIKSQTSTH